MQYALMIHIDPGVVAALSDAERDAVQAEYLALGEDIRTVSATRLEPVETATSVRVVDGRRLVTDGPFADTKEVLGGIWIIEADDLDEALDAAARIPATRFGGVVEVRPVWSS